MIQRRLLAGWRLRLRCVANMFQKRSEQEAASVDCDLNAFGCVALLTELLFLDAISEFDLGHAV